MDLGKYWNKGTKIAAGLVSICTVVVFALAFYNHFAKQSDHEALASEVETNYATQEDLVAANKNVQQTNYDFWIYRTKQEIYQKWSEYRNATNPDEKEQIRDEIEELEKDLKRYKDKLEELK